MTSSPARSDGSWCPPGALLAVLALLFLASGCARLVDAMDLSGNHAAAVNAHGAARPAAAEPGPALPHPGNGQARTPPRATPWRQAQQVLYLGGRRNGAPKRFTFTTLEAKATRIVLRSVLDSPLDVSGTCDGEIVLGTSPLRPLPAGTPFRFRLEGRYANSLTSIPVDLGYGLRRCELRVSGPSGLSDTIRVEREDWRKDPLAGIDGRHDTCNVPPANGLTPLQRVFHADRILSQTCMLPPGRTRPLVDARDGFNAKVEALLGKSLPDSFFDAGDPHAPIDFSAAPRLKLIYASYLDIKADFSGVVFLRLLRHHAARGVPIRVIVTEILTRPKDRRQLERLAADHPNVQIQEFAWPKPPGAGLADHIAHLHRTHHIKLLATIAEKKDRSRAIIGGRNVHDGFLFDRPLDLRRYPELHNYRKLNGLSLSYYSNFHDLDVEISGDAAVRTLAAHFSTIWHRDLRTGISPPFSGNRPGETLREGYRHFISVPYTDGRALERYYVELIDAAERSIEIVNPYLNPTPAIYAAIERALGRGVRIEVVTRINLKGDLGGTILTRLNQLFVEKYADRISIREYRGRNVVLHAKLLLIDGVLSVISSVNLNHRSFLHDSENGIVIYSRAEYRRLRKVFEFFEASSVAVLNDVDIPLQYRMLLGIDMLREAL